MGAGRSVRLVAGLAVGLVAMAGLVACDGPEVVGGRLTVSGTGAHPAGVSVQAFSNTSETLVAEVLTDAAGRYRFGDQTLPAGTYRLRFNRDEWWGGTDWGSATPVPVSSASPPSIDATIALRTGTVSGAVREYDGTFDTDVWYAVAIAENVLGGPTFTSEQAVLQPDGSLDYELTGLPAGTYRIRLERVVRRIGDRQVVFSGSTLRSGSPLYELGAGASLTADDGVFNEADFGLGLVFVDGTGEPYTGAGAMLVLEASTLEPVAVKVQGLPEEYVPVPLVRVRFYAPAPYRSGDYVGESPTNPLGVVMDRSSWLDHVGVNLVGQDCDPSVFAAGGDHQGEDLSGQNLINCDVLRENDLRGVDFRGADLSRVDFSRADLTGADLTGADVTGVDWVYATCPDGTLIESSTGTCTI